MRHVLTRVGRPARVVVLDPPHRLKDCEDNGDIACKYKGNKLCFLPEVALRSIKASTLRGDVAYMSSMLAFNLGFHVTWLHQWLSCHCFDNLCSSEGQNSCLEVALLENSKVDVSPLCKLLPPSDCLPEQAAEAKENVKGAPLKFAFHVRIGHVRFPTSGFSQFSTEDMQDLVDVDGALQDYFKCSRALARGDLFAVGVHIDGKKHRRFSNKTGEERTIYFKVSPYFFSEMYILSYACFFADLCLLSWQVIAMEPESEPFLWVNCNQTALVLGSSVPSRVPPPLISGRSDRRPITWMVPVIEQLARVLAPPLSNAPSLPLKTAVLLCGPAGVSQEP